MKHWREWDLRNIGGPINFTDEKNQRKSQKITEKSTKNKKYVNKIQWEIKKKKKIPNKVINITKKSIKSHG